MIAVAGNPNVGKSTLFNNLTGLKQHTGNWVGKTVANAFGTVCFQGESYVLVDIPGTYSLMAHSAEEEVARNFLCFEQPDVVVVVCDATCLERNCNLVLQILELTNRVVVCVNLMDEAQRKKIQLDLEGLSKKLGVPVVGTVARKKKSLEQLLAAIKTTINQEKQESKILTEYQTDLETALGFLEPAVHAVIGEQMNARFVSLKLLEKDLSLLKEIDSFFHIELRKEEKIAKALQDAEEFLYQQGMHQEEIRDTMVDSLVKTAEKICENFVIRQRKAQDSLDRKLDRLFTSRLTGYPMMMLLLAGVFWITMVGANGLSEQLADILLILQNKLSDLFYFFHAPTWLHDVFILGIYRVLSFVISVMLPPMAIFFPLFTLLEDVGYLPRVAYNLDKSFQRCNACGKQALSMCMGFGCNAAGVVGCRIIDSKRERLIAILTNNFVPCNGRLPALLTLISLFFVNHLSGFSKSLLSALLLASIIVLGIFLTFLVSRVLSKTLLKGVPSSFVLELPPYRKPQVIKVVIRSIFDRTLYVLGRAAIVAAPAGILLFLLANITVAGNSLLQHGAAFFDPFGKLLGMDGVIFIAFLLAFPANELVLPIIIMTYLAQNSLLEFENLTQIRTLFLDNGWSLRTAVCTILFFLLHWPCSTTLLTIKKESGSWKYVFLAFLIPTGVGMVLCFIVNFFLKMAGL